MSTVCTSCIGVIAHPTVMVTPGLKVVQTMIEGDERLSFVLEVEFL